MSVFLLIVLLITLVALIIISGFFSGSETGMMAVNRYRLRHLVRKKHRKAMRVAKLLDRPDRLLGVILIGNTFANILASAIVTVIAIKLFGDWAIAFVTILLTLAILIFAEVIPKTMAATIPQRFSFFVSLPLTVILIICYPAVWLVNTISNGVLKLFRFKVKQTELEHLTSEELSTIVREAGDKIPDTHQDMLLAILELEKITVDDIMIPRNDVVGIDLEDPWQDILDQLTKSQHPRLPVYECDINNIKGILHLRSALNLLADEKLTKNYFLDSIEEPYYIPEGTPLHRQLFNFRTLKRRLSLVVDEYGDIQGIVTLEDLLEEIVGEFTTKITASYGEMRQQSDGSYLVDGSMNIRDLNRIMKSDFDVTGPKTLSGLIIEELEMIPKTALCLMLSGFRVEVVSIKGNRINEVRIHKKII